MTWLAIAAAIGVVGCGRIFFEPLDDPADCWDAWRGGDPQLDPPQLVELSSSPVQQDASLANDDRELYFSSGEANTDLFVSTRTDRSSPWGPPRPVSELNTPWDEGRISLTADGTLAVFTSEPLGGGRQDLWMATRATPDEPFGAPSQDLLAALNTVNSDFNPELSPDGLQLYWAPDIAGVGRFIMRSTRSSRAEPFGPGERLTELELTAWTYDATLSPDLQVIVFGVDDSSCTPGCATLHVATREATDQTFGAPVPIPTARVDGYRPTDTELSSNGCELYFAAQDSSDTAIYVANVR